MTAAISAEARSPNRQLYRDGERYLRGLAPPAQGKYTTAELAPIARAHGTSVAEVRTAAEFVAAVNRIAAVAGARFKGLLLSGEHALLTPVLVCDLCRRPPPRIQAAMRQAAQGLNPLARPVPEGTPPEYALWDYDLHRLRLARSFLDGSTPSRPPNSPARDEQPLVYRDATATRMAAAAILVALGRPAAVKHPPPKQTGAEGGPAATPANAARKARLLVEAVTHDLPLALSRRCPSPEVLRQLRSATKAVHLLATRLADRTPPPPAGRTDRAAPPPHDHAGRPDERPGTYVVVLRAERADVLRIGRLGTFWLPHGYFLYVGSAFSKNLVLHRTVRHLSPDAPKLWNLDHLKDFASPVEVWWTHHAERVEHAWALAMAELPGYSCPAPRCGGNDCKSCPAHLYHTFRRPSCEAFTEVVRQTIPDHGPIHRRRCPLKRGRPR